MSEPMTEDEAANVVMAYCDEVLDLLVDGYRKMQEKDSASGATDEHGALGGVAMIADRAVQVGPASLSTLLGMAVRRLAKGVDGG